MTAVTSYELIDDTDALKNALGSIADAQSALTGTNISPHTPLLYVDLEGNDLCRSGTISLIQIHVPNIQRTFVVDVTTLGSAAFTTAVPLKAPSSPVASLSVTSPTSPIGDPLSLKSILESPVIVKCFFDVRNDADALYNIYGISMESVVDLQILEVATRRGPRRLLNGLARAIRNDGELEPEVLKEWLEVKSRGKALFNSSAIPRQSVSPSGESNSMPLSHRGSATASQSSPTANSIPTKAEPNFAVFDIRPIPRDLLEYSVNDVIHLPKLWAIYDAKLNSTWRPKAENEAIWRLQLAKQDVYYGKNGNMALSPF